MAFNNIIVNNQNVTEIESIPLFNEKDNLTKSSSLVDSYFLTKDMNEYKMPTTNKILNYYTSDGKIKYEVGLCYIPYKVYPGTFIRLLSNPNGSLSVISLSTQSYEEFLENPIFVNKVWGSARVITEYSWTADTEGICLVSGVANTIEVYLTQTSPIKTIKTDISSIQSEFSVKYITPEDVITKDNWYVNSPGNIAANKNTKLIYFFVQKDYIIETYQNPDGGPICSIASTDNPDNIELYNYLNVEVLASGHEDVFSQWTADRDCYVVLSAGLKNTLTYSVYLEGRIVKLENLILDNNVVPFSGDLNRIGISSPITVKNGSKYFSIEQRFTKNINNFEGNTTLLELSNDEHTLSIVLEHHLPSETVLLPLKENTARQSNIKYVNFPMAVKQDYLKVIKDGSTVFSLLQDDTLNRPFIRRIPAFIIKYIPKENEDLSTLVNLKLYITLDSTDNIVDMLYIKNNQTIIYQYQFSKTTDLSLQYRTIRDAIKSINGYSFLTEFKDIDYLTVADLLPTKSAGLPFVTEYSSNCLTTGTMVYDNYAVFIEALDNDMFELEAVENNNVVYLYYEGQLLTSVPFDFDTISFGSEDTSIINVSYDPYYTSANTKRPIIKGLSGHEFSTQPSYANYSDMEEEGEGNTGKGTSIGCVNYIAHSMRNLGWSNVSTDQVTNYMMDKNYPMPKKCYFIEEDDLGGRIRVSKIFSDEEAYVRQMEIIKMTGIKMCYALMLGDDKQLFEKIKNGTATEEEKNTLTTMMPNEWVYRLRSMIHGYGWSVSIHTFVSPITHPTAARYDEVVDACRNSIEWVERMLGVTPKTYVTDLTGNSSPYFRRVMQMCGLLRVYHDDDFNYSQGRQKTYVDRDGFYYRTTFQDLK